MKIFSLYSLKSQEERQAIYDELKEEAIKIRSDKQLIDTLEELKLKYN